MIVTLFKILLPETYKLELIDTSPLNILSFRIFRESIYVKPFNIVIPETNKLLLIETLLFNIQLPETYKSLFIITLLLKVLLLDILRLLIYAYSLIVISS